MDLRDKNALVTGAGGFIGSHKRAREAALAKHPWERHLDELERIVGQVAHCRMETPDLDVVH